MEYREAYRKEGGWNIYREDIEEYPDAPIYIRVVRRFKSHYGSKPHMEKDISSLIEYLKEVVTGLEREEPIIIEYYGIVFYDSTPLDGAATSFGVSHYKRELHVRGEINVEKYELVEKLFPRKL